MTCPYCNNFLGHKIFCLLIKYALKNGDEKPEWLKVMEGHGGLFMDGFEYPGDIKT